MSDMVFYEADCAIGGCACPVWSDWFAALEASAHHEPDGRRLSMLDDDDWANALSAICVRIAPTFSWAGPPCSNPECRRYRARTPDAPHDQ